MGIQLELTLDDKKLSELLELNMIGKGKAKIANNASNLENISKILKEIFQTDFELDYDDKDKKWILRSNNYSILEKIRKKLADRSNTSPNMLKEIKLSIKLNEYEIEKLSKIISKIHRVVMLDYTASSENMSGFIISKFSSSRYVNALVALPDVPLISIIRFTSRHKVCKNERYNFHVDKLTPFLDKEEIKSFWLNNYLKSKRTEKDSIEENKDEFQRIITNPEGITRVLGSSLRGVITGAGILLPWPFSSFELATTSHKLYTLFLADIKIVNDPKPCHNIDILNSVLDQEINEINYLRGQDLSQNLVKLEGELYLSDIGKLNIRKKDIMLITLRSVVSNADLKAGKTVLGFVLGQAFRSILEKPLLLLHAYNGEEMIEPLIDMNSELIRLKDRVRNPLNYDVVMEITKQIYKISYKNKGNELIKLSGNLELLEFIRRILNDYRTAYKKALNDELEGKMMIIAGQS